MAAVEILSILTNMKVNYSKLLPFQNKYGLKACNSTESPDVTKEH